MNELTEKQLNIIGAPWHFNLLVPKEKAEVFAFARAAIAADHRLYRKDECQPKLDVCQPEQGVCQSNPVESKTQAGLSVMDEAQVELPPLPEPWQGFQRNESWKSWENVVRGAMYEPRVMQAYTGEQMREYARAALVQPQGGHQPKLSIHAGSGLIDGELTTRPAPGMKAEHMPLTDDQLSLMAAASLDRIDDGDYFEIARAVEAKHGITGNPC